MLEISYQRSLENILLDLSVIEVEIDINLNNNTNKSIPKSYHNENKITFILMSYSLEIDKGVYNYCLIAYPEFYSMVIESYNSSVYFIFNRMAKQLDLKTDINNTLDNQIKK